MKLNFMGCGTNPAPKNSQSAWGSCPLPQQWCLLWRGCNHSDGPHCSIHCNSWKGSPAQITGSPRIEHHRGNGQDVNNLLPRKGMEFISAMSPTTLLHHNRQCQAFCYYMLWSIYCIPESNPGLATCPCTNELDKIW